MWLADLGLRRSFRRKTESDERINMRIAKASVELATAPQFDYIIENNDLDIALMEAKKLVLSFVVVEKDLKE
jgi:guanylate kinase